ncbi:ABC transporter permease [Kerstersia similis]|uniref:ABC transporter permease n=1 Tax=Kerstersia similis TaxID=206505 RepID=UPI0039EF22AC
MPSASLSLAGSGWATLRRRSPLALRHLGLVLAIAWLVLLAVMALAPSWVATRDPNASDFMAMLAPPSPEHFFGTDALGRDLFSRIVYGARYSISIGLGAMGVALLLALPLGIAGGVGNTLVDGFVMRLTDILGAFPEMLLAILVIALIGPGTSNLIVALGIAATPKLMRVIRAQTRTVMLSGYVEYGTLLGQARHKTILRHVLPNAIGTLPVLVTISLGFAVISTASLSFLGLGPQAPTPEWGLMLSESLSTLRVAWWAGVFPGVMITSLVIALTLLANALQASYEKRRPA